MMTSPAVHFIYTDIWIVSYILKPVVNFCHEYGSWNFLKTCLKSFCLPINIEICYDYPYHHLMGKYEVPYDTV